MRHGKKRYQLNRFTSWHKSTINSLARNLLIHQRIQTTLTRAKAVRPLAEKLISLAKENSLAAKRQAVKVLGEHKLVSILFNDIGPRFKDRASGFTRIIHLGVRRGDDATLAILELTEIKEKKKPVHKKEKETKTQEDVAQEMPPVEEKKPQIPEAPKEKEKPPVTKKPTKKFLGGIRGIFKKQRDSL